MAGCAVAAEIPADELLASPVAGSIPHNDQRIYRYQARPGRFGRQPVQNLSVCTHPRHVHQVALVVHGSQASHTAEAPRQINAAVQQAPPPRQLASRANARAGLVVATRVTPMLFRATETDPD